MIYINDFELMTYIIDSLDLKIIITYKYSFIC